MDSNGKFIDKRLKPEALVIKAERFRVGTAIDTIPFVYNPEKVTDIVFQVGLNDLRRGNSHERIQEKTLEMQLKYNTKIPNARQQLTCLPPLGDRHAPTNHLPQKLAAHTQSNLISIKSFH